MKVNVNRVLDILEELNRINQAKLSEIEWIKDGEKIKVTKEMIDSYEYIGLNNVGFITYEYYL